MMKGRIWQERLKDAISGLRSPRPEAPPPPPPRPPRRAPPAPPPRPAFRLPERTISKDEDDDAVQGAPPSYVHLELLTESALEVEVRLDNGQLVHTKYDLNLYLGNDNGNFTFKGQNFSHSARNVRLETYTLHAELRRRDGARQADKVGLEIELPCSRNGQEVRLKVVEYHVLHGPDSLDDSARLVTDDREHVRNLRLYDNFLLAAECLQPTGLYATSYVNLNKYLGNEHGKFRRGGSNFSHSAQDVRLTGTTLRARLSQPGGQRKPTAIDVSRVVRCEQGRLVPFSIRNAHVCEVPTPFQHQDGSGNDEVLPSCLRLQLLESTIVLGECRTKDGKFQMSTFDLNSILGGAGGRFRLFGDNFVDGRLGHACNVKLVGSILSADFPQHAGSFPASINGYQTDTIDMRDVLAVVDGRFELKRTANGCSGCEDMFRAGILYSTWGKKIRTKPNPKAYNEGRVNPDCGICKLVPAVVAQAAPGARECEVHVAFETGIGPSGIETAQIEVDADGKKACYKFFLSHATDVVPRALEPLPRAKESQSWFEPKQRWPLVHSWIEQCFSQHKECKRTGRPRLPTRCLDIGAHEHDVIRVLTPFREMGRYACLSHCWGGHQPCTLTSATLQVYSQGIPPIELPQTYKDAIAICRLLGLRYIWVDSLCILQDDKEDWLRESPKMVDYYGNCHVCIAATNVSGPSAGLKIRDRPAGIRVDGIGAEGHKYQLIGYPSGLIGAVSHFSRADSAKLEQDFPLMKRAWVLQERWLAPRTLHFCGQEVVLECSQDLKCECGRNNEAFTLWKGDPTKVMPIENQSDGMVLKRQSGKRWSQFVSAYSALDLSFQSDRLPAVSGLARRFAAQHAEAKTSPGRYLAGVWEHTLHDELVWFAGDVLLQVQRSTEADAHQLHTGLALAKRGRLTEYIAPSWSWAGVTDAVSYRAWNDNAPLCTLMNADVVLSGIDPFGAVAPGCSLTIRGKLFETAWTVTGSRPNQKSFVLSDVHATQRLDKKNSNGVRFLPDYTITKPGSNQITAGERLYVFPVLTQKLSLSSWSYRMNEEKAMQDMKALVERVRSTACLVLRQRGSAADGLAVFERVGFTEYANVTAHAENLDLNPYEDRTLILV